MKCINTDVLTSGIVALCMLLLHVFASPVCGWGSINFNSTLISFVESLF